MPRKVISEVKITKTKDLDEEDEDFDEFENLIDPPSNPGNNPYADQQPTVEEGLIAIQILRSIFRIHGIMNKNDLEALRLVEQACLKLQNSDHHQNSSVDVYDNNGGLNNEIVVDPMKMVKIEFNESANDSSEMESSNTDYYNNKKLFGNLNSTNCCCQICGKNFTRKSDLKRHVDSVHRGIINFRCESCHKNFKRKSDLKRHTETIHRGSISFPCQSCGKNFSRKRDLKRHTELIHEGSINFQCQICGKNYTRKSDLKRHTDAAHEGENVAYDETFQNDDHDEDIKSNHLLLPSSEGFLNTTNDFENVHEGLKVELVEQQEPCLSPKISCVNGVHKVPKSKLIRCESRDKNFRTKRNLNKHKCMSK